MQTTQLGPIDPVLTLKEVTATVLYSRSQIYRMVRAGAFPAPIRLGPARIGWRRSSVARWLNQREDSAGGPAPPS